MGSTEYSRELTRLSVAKIVHTIGYHTSNTSPLEILTDIAAQYIKSLGKLTNEYANLYNFSEANLDHLGLAFHHYHINLPELEEYISNVDMGGPPIHAPNFPIPKENHLNFLKPGSKECVTRPVHIHEHLPPMYNMNEVVNENEPEPIVEDQVQDEKQENSGTIFKRPSEISPSDNFKRPKLVLEEEGRPTREISSVMMTTSGFISPAREGKLPESRTPLATLETTPTPNAIPPSNPPPTSKPKGPKRVEKKKEKAGKELSKVQEDKVKKVTTPREPKIKTNDKQIIGNELRGIKAQNQNSNRANKNSIGNRLKTDKSGVTITPVVPLENIKLFSEPDRKKANIFRKISAKADKSESKIKLKDEKLDSRETSPLLVIDEPFLETTNPMNKFSLLTDVTVEIVPKAHNPPPPNPPAINQERYFSDDSPPGTPLTPKTPEMVSHSPPLTKEKKRREKPQKVKRIPKQTNIDSGDFELYPRPKTPEVPDMFQPIHFPVFPPPLGPGLIPQSSLFHNMPLPLGVPRLRPPYPSPLIGSNNMIMDLTIPPIAPPILIDDDDDEEEEQPPKPEKKPKEHKKEKKDKIKKKNKKDKVKDKAEKKKLKEEKKEKIKKEKKDKKKDKEQRDSDVLVPKLTLKLGSPASTVTSTETDRKLNIKPVIKKEEEEPKVTHTELAREVSPELAKISALVTGQPKPKVTTPIIQNDLYPPSGDTYHSQMKKSMFKPIPKKEPEPIPAIFQPPPSRYIDEVIEEPVVVTSPSKHQGPGRPRIHPVKQKPVKAQKQQVAQPPPQQVPIKVSTEETQLDKDGNEVWICPACGKQDDGSPMIGCDDCDAWYHWVCVGIQVPPDDNENWYCRHCLAKKQEVHQSDKKKKRKRKEKKEH